MSYEPRTAGPDELSERDCYRGCGRPAPSPWSDLCPECFAAEEGPYDAAEQAEAQLYEAHHQQRDLVCKACGSDSWQAVGQFEADDYLERIELFCHRCGEHREIPL